GAPARGPATRCRGADVRWPAAGRDRRPFRLARWPRPRLLLPRHREPVPAAARGVMNETEDLREEELLLADFLDDAYEQLERGDRPDPGTLADPALAPRGRKLLDGLLVVLDAAAALRGEGSRLLADALDSSDCEPPETAERLPDPFPGEFRL